MNDIERREQGIDDENARRLVEEAERGYAMHDLPEVIGPGVLLADLTPEVRAAVIARAEITRTTAAEVIDAALRESLHVS